MVKFTAFVIAGNVGWPCFSAECPEIKFESAEIASPLFYLTNDNGHLNQDAEYVKIEYNAENVKRLLLEVIPKINYSECFCKLK